MSRKQFETQDLNLSAVLIAKGFELTEVIKNNYGKATFCFDSTQEIQDVIQQYWNNKLLINPQELFHALKLLKNRIYSNY
jgi:hypothetical protein